MSVDPDGAPAGGAVAFTVAWEDKQGSNPPTIRVAGPANRAYEITASQTTGTHQKPWESDHTGMLGVWTRSFNASGTALHSDGTDTSRLASQPLMRVSGGRQEGIVVVSTLRRC